jgi:hypothetical protein
MPLIWLRTNISTKIDEEDFLFLYFIGEWCLKNDYAFNGTVGYMHIIIAKRMNLNVDKTIDHVDRNRLNNKRDNIRLATATQNHANVNIQSNNTSGYKGVSFYSRYNKWEAYITVKQKKIRLGYFDDIIEAAQTYDRAAKHHFGEFAHTNFSEETNV